MSDKTGIEWTDATWNPVTGCTEVSPGCDHCYAKTFAERWRGVPGHYFGNGFDVQLRPDKLNLPRTWRKPRKVFVNSMSDLFHDSVPDEYIAQVFAVMAETPQHTYQVLTKRHGRMRSLLNKWAPITGVPPWTFTGPWPLPNVWLGVSVETQQWADIRIPALLDTPAAVRFLSCEPLLGPLDIGPYLGCWRKNEQGDFTDSAIDWVIVGGESGRGARPMSPAWAKAIRDAAATYRVAFHFKQWGEWAPTGQVSLGYLSDPRERHIGEPVDVNGFRVLMRRVGKKAAGRELDGRTWDEFPAVAP